VVETNRNGCVKMLEDLRVTIVALRKKLDEMGLSL